MVESREERVDGTLMNVEKPKEVKWEYIF
jgi:hypothetical protein